MKPGLRFADALRWACFSALVAMLATLGAAVDVSAEDSLEAAYSAIQPSLVLIGSFKGRTLLDTGSGFVVGNRNGHALIITNRHVVASGDNYVAIRQYPTTISATLHLVRVGTADDVALLEASSGSIPPVSFLNGLPTLGHRIAVAGYPRTQLTFAQLGLGLTPSIHAGTVNALPANGYYVQYDAQTEPGNSGGPLFDANTGAVFGIVVAKVKGANESNIAIAFPRLAKFLSNAGVGLRTRPDSDATAAVPSPTPIPTPVPTPAIDVSACRSALSDFYTASTALNDAFNRYIRAQQSASSSAQVATTRVAMSVAQIAAAYELRAIRSVIDAEEPKFIGPESSIEQSGALETARLTSRIINHIHMRDGYALNWSQARYSLFGNIANGGSGFQLDQTPLNESNFLTGQIDSDFSELRLARPCQQ